jgi:hypothetical protein
MIRIYKITSSQTDNVYIGSTKKILSDRFLKHKHTSNSTSSKIILQYDDAKIELIEEVELEQRYIRERYWIEFYGDKCVNIKKCTNIMIPGMTRKEYSKEYYEINKNYVKERTKVYYDANKYKLRQKSKDFRDANKDKIKEYQLEKITCECGSTLSRGNMPQHRKSKKHLKFLEL